MTKILKNFWVIEGLDGSGTTTQLKILGKKLEQLSKKFYLTQEPTENETGKFLRRVLKGEFTVPQSTIARLFTSDRDDHLYNDKYGIIKHLKSGEIVISDRYLFSSLAYQGSVLNYDKIMELNSDFEYPEYVIYLRVPAESCINRVNNRGQEKEIYEKLDFQKKVFDGYEKCMNNLPNGCMLIQIDGSMSIEKVSSEIFLKLGL